MDHYVTGATIKALREKQRMTQAELAEKLCVSDKAVSKWENGRGFPDVSLLEPLGKALHISVAELLCGQAVVNTNRASNMLKCALRERGRDDFLLRDTAAGTGNGRAGSGTQAGSAEGGGRDLCIRGTSHEQGALPVLYRLYDAGQLRDQSTVSGRKCGNAVLFPQKRMAVLLL